MSESIRTWFAIIIIVLFVLAWPGDAMSNDRPNWNVHTILVSTHHGQNNVSNEKHNGLGIARRISDKGWAGITRFKNSHNRYSNLLSLSARQQIGTTDAAIGILGGFVDNYEDDELKGLRVGKWEGIIIPTLHYKLHHQGYLDLYWVPDEVTALGFSIKF